MKDKYDTPLFKIERCPACDESVEHPAFVVIDRKSNVTVGSVKWNLGIDEYCLFPRGHTAWNWDALFEVLNFLVDVLASEVLDQAKGPAS